MLLFTNKGSVILCQVKKLRLNKLKQLYFACTCILTASTSCCGLLSIVEELCYLFFLQYVHYEVDYSDVEMNKEEKEKDKKKEEKVGNKLVSNLGQKIDQIKCSYIV